MPESQVRVMLVAVLSVTTGTPGAFGRAEGKKREFSHTFLFKKDILTMLNRNFGP